MTDAKHEAPAEPWYGDRDPHEVDQAYGNYDGTSCEQCGRERVMVGGATGKRICEKCGLYQEAPAEGAGEREIALALREARNRLHSGKVVLGDIDAIMDAVMFLEDQAALRASSSAPEAREEAQPVAWLVGNGGGTIMTRAAAWVAGKRDQGASVTPLYTHPATPSADKLRIAVEALERVRGWINRRVEIGTTGATANVIEIDQALAALKAEGGA